MARWPVAALTAASVRRRPVEMDLEHGCFGFDQGRVPAGAACSAARLYLYPMPDASRIPPDDELFVDITDESEGWSRPR